MTTTRVRVAEFVPIEQTTTSAEVVNVRISYGIIDRFSEGLYSYPNKAFEELISNSYDAGAGKVWIILPDDLSAPDAAIAVVDDGYSMDLEGLRDLWKIGSSTKRALEATSRTQPIRQPIGKFGIGKLATYVLANQLTYICYKEDIFRAVTMNFGIVTGELTDMQDMSLDVVELSRESALAALTNVGVSGTVLDVLQSPESPIAWTAAILTKLKPAGIRIKRGRLRWILETALPLNPQFALWLNDEYVESSKMSEEPRWTFRSGESDMLMPASKRWAWRAYASKIDGEWQLTLPHSGPVRGTAELYTSSLKRGKSEDWGRSHGFFVRVRDRLINIDDESFGIDVELHHGALTRFRMVVDVNGLDEWIASPRESIRESPALDEIRAYLLDVFNQARLALPDVDRDDRIHLISASGRIESPPPAMSQAPLRRLVQRAVDGDQSVREAVAWDDQDSDAATELLASEGGLFDRILVEVLDDRSQLVRYDPQRTAIVLNANHPFVSNYMDIKGVSEPLRFVGASDLLTEAFMLDEAIPAEVARRIMRRRHEFLGALVDQHPRSSAVVARKLRDAGADEKGLEQALADAMRILGFEVQSLGGQGGTDGIALAKLGNREGAAKSYSVTLEAKSTGRAALEYVRSIEKGMEDEDSDESGSPRKTKAGKSKGSAKIRTSTAQTSILRVHREELDAHYTLLVAPGFQGEDDDTALIGKVCKNDGITPIRIVDLARLVELFPVRLISPESLQEMFKTCRSPQATQSYVETLEATPLADSPPVGDIIRIISDYHNRRNPVTIDALNAAIYERCDRDLGVETIDVIVRGLHALAPRSLYMSGNQVALNVSEAVLREELIRAIAHIDAPVGSGFKLDQP